MRGFKFKLPSFINDELRLLKMAKYVFIFLIVIFGVYGGMLKITRDVSLSEILSSNYIIAVFFIVVMTYPFQIYLIDIISGNIKKGVNSKQSFVCLCILTILNVIVPNTNLFAFSFLLMSVYNFFPKINLSHEKDKKMFHIANVLTVFLLIVYAFIYLVIFGAKK